MVREPFVGLTENKPDYEEVSVVDRSCGLEFKSVVISGLYRNYSVIKIRIMATGQLENVYAPGFVVVTGCAW